MQKLSNLLKISIFLAEVKKPILSKLIFVKKSCKLKTRKLGHHYNYRYIQEYEFSPSSTPSISCCRKSFKKRNFRRIRSIFMKCQCLGSLRGEKGKQRDYPLMALPSIGVAVAMETPDLSDSGGDEDSIDERAERFIERFYEEVRMQRQESIFKLGREMLEI